MRICKPKGNTQIKVVDLYGRVIQVYNNSGGVIKFGSNYKKGV